MTLLLGVTLLFATHNTQAAWVSGHGGNGVSLMRRQDPGLDFLLANWIWTNEVTAGSVGDAPVGSRPFRKSFAPPQGKTPSHMNIAVATDNIGILYVNGNQVIVSPDWLNPQTSCVPLISGTNVIALNVTNTAVPTLNPAGLLVSADFFYTDGTSSHIVSDSSWRFTAPTIPVGFQSPTFDDSRWSTAISQVGYPSSPWDAITISPLVVGNTVTFASSQFIWTNELPGPGQDVPAGPRAFRRTITLSPSTVSVSAEILLTVDNEFSLYVNGRFIGSGTDWEVASRFAVNDIQGPNVEVAIFAVNTLPGPAGVLASIKLVEQQILGCPTAVNVVSDSQWKAFSGTPPVGFQVAGFDDSRWPPAVAEGNVNSSPWTNGVTIPTGTTPAGTPITGAPGGPARHV
ncbi:hypothetical protein D9758_004541 [Tetrapyrgos nigripes]|uniref:Lectin n=1 Tax=Tetrapyrgos nigripes TaxID=182062 RepID=A0A8H5LYQ5_9AGAR|nr:hypothetical protein D9758_004541 [Tetrapyrgos nigripes]